MISPEFLRRLHGIRPTAFGWMALCPAHPDRNPSLSVRVNAEGRLLLHCFAGCAVAAIRAALNLAPAVAAGAYQDVQPSASRPSWRQTASALMHGALLRWLRAESVLTLARNLDASTWTDADVEAALNAVAKAYDDLDSAELLEDLAFSLRRRHLEEERLARES